jgi:hypothetical protein
LAAARVRPITAAARRVDRLALVAAPADDRADVDDRAALGAGHQPGRALQVMDRAPGVGPEHAVDQLVADHPDQRALDDAGVVDQHVELLPRLEDRLVAGLDRRRVGDVAGQRQRAHAVAGREVGRGPGQAVRS